LSNEEGTRITAVEMKFKRQMGKYAGLYYKTNLKGENHMKRFRTEPTLDNISK
jgi:hypothetical protein